VVRELFGRVLNRIAMTALIGPPNLPSSSRAASQLPFLFFLWRGYRGLTTRGAEGFFHQFAHANEFLSCCLEQDPFLLRAGLCRTIVLLLVLNMLNVNVMLLVKCQAGTDAFKAFSKLTRGYFVTAVRSTSIKLRNELMSYGRVPTRVSPLVRPPSP
jgi:hypothetical protein